MTKYNGPIKEVKLMEKVILPEEVAEAIERLRNADVSDYGIIIRSSFNAVIDNDPSGNVLYHWTHEREGKNGDYLLQALSHGYEIEPEQPKFQSGDKVFLYVNGSAYIETLTMKNPHVKGDWGTEQGCGCISEKDFRQATPEEIFWLETLGRERVGEVKNGDAVLFEDESISFIDFSTHRGFLREMMKERGFKGIYPAESFKSFPGDSK